MIRWFSAAAMLVLVTASASAQPSLAQGELVGEVTATSAIVRTRLSLNDKPNAGTTRTRRLILTKWRDDLPEALVGAPGRVRIHFGLDGRLAGAKATEWRSVDASTNFAAQFVLKGLQPRKRYYYQAEAAAPGTGTPSVTRRGSIGTFETAPLPQTAAEVTFCV
ncbi:MAG: hypothetical protein J7M14_02260, partial [Planctomycetes bacterium]|nr:hypothetical protein [Planctomycetota bacterium]